MEAIFTGWPKVSTGLMMDMYMLVRDLVEQSRWWLLRTETALMRPAAICLEKPRDTGFVILYQTILKKPLGLVLQINLNQ